MGRITEALKKATDNRVEQIQRIPEYQYIAKKVDDTSLDEHLIAFHDPRSPVTEQYNMLRTNIQIMKNKRQYKTFLMTSSIDTEGKTITSINLSITLARGLQSGKVLLIDADMRRGKVLKYFGLHEYAGLSELLSEDIPEKDVMLDPGIDNLVVISSGAVPKNPSELLNSRKMQDLLIAFRKTYDYIIIDSPPVMPLTDACILGPMADAALVIFQAGRTQREMVKHTEKRMVQAGANVVGLVMTKIEQHLPNYLSRYMNKYESYYAYSNYKYKEEEVNA